MQLTLKTVIQSLTGKSVNDSQVSPFISPSEPVAPIITLFLLLLTIEERLLQAVRTINRNEEDAS